MRSVSLASFVSLVLLVGVTALAASLSGCQSQAARADGGSHPDGAARARDGASGHVERVDVASGGGVRNVVLVHGAWADGSGWKGVRDELVRAGYRVSIVQHPLTSFAEDVAAVRRVLALQDGPCLLVAHSYGGAVITEAGTAPGVAGLVYVAAHMPDAGESEAMDGKRFPSDLSKSGAIKRTPDGYLYLEPARFHELFAADLSREQAEFNAHAQVLIHAENFNAVITDAAWRHRPSWMIVAASDRTIHPDLERWYAARAGSETVELKGASHSVYISRAKEVAAVIKKAAASVGRRD